ncbi:aminodeoxychorismate synthase component I [Photobacterium jeanii]|uniref:aminodeoxychorismate synthase n=1 Tax=Photobacterium jeanii TaxID=858640 RepID=A0A178KM48_9GAMM|nr:aminodeoxychorismate synthase component I [Photobacterium jeanii]OAN18270.1 aminodeoxychorismate synthase component I [Photobacterium jeanii]PST92051.1 aminodeoxychorismate synthase component I [Photobacterium jeanii]
MICKSQSPLIIEQLEYHPTASLEWFAPLAAMPWAMILRSAANNHPDNRFDILVADPLATLETQGDTTRIKLSDSDEKTSTSDPFELVATLEAQLLPELKPMAGIPFLGGALGFWGYDLGRRVEKVPCLAEHDLSTPDMAIGIYDWALIADHQAQKLFLISPQGSERLAWLNTQKERYTCKNMLSHENHGLQHSDDFALTSDWSANMTIESYCNKFKCIQDYLTSGDCYQINLAQRFSAQYQGDEWQAYLKLEQQNGAPFSGFIRLADSAILSVSPERFLQHQDKAIETKPIKGTRPRFTDPSEDKQSADDLRQADKDRSENLMIVDLLRNDIGRVAKAGTVRVPKLFDIESFPAVHHLVSTVTGELDQQYTPTDLLRACFPGGSITGAPKVRAMEIIEELEPHRRNVYCGSIGYISRCGTMDTSITIRTLVAEQQKIHAWAGGGIVADSQDHSEYQETLDKLSKILPLLSK